jgi:hypothetical protein
MSTKRNVVPMGSRNGEENFVIGFMCLTDFECELGYAEDGNRVFPSKRSLRKHLKCTDACGIVEVEVHFRRLVQEGTDP